MTRLSHLFDPAEEPVGLQHARHIFDLVTAAVREDATDFIGDLRTIGTVQQMRVHAAHALDIVTDGECVPLAVLREAIDALAERGWETLQGWDKDRTEALADAIEAGDLTLAGEFIPYPVAAQ